MQKKVKETLKNRQRLKKVNKTQTKVICFFESYFFLRRVLRDSHVRGTRAFEGLARSRDSRVRGTRTFEGLVCSADLALLGFGSAYKSKCRPRGYRYGNLDDKLNIKFGEAQGGSGASGLKTCLS